MEELGCLYQTFHNSSLSIADKCTVAETQCEGLYEMINFFSIAACTFGSCVWLFYLIGAFLIFLVFKFISETIEGFVSPSIVYMTEWLGISEALAAVTLLALANGAGDVITALVASGESGGVSYNIGALFGAGLFVMTIVVCVTILKSDTPVQLDASVIYRDIGFYIISALFTVACGIYGELTIATSVIMLGIYIVMVLVVVLQDHLKSKEKHHKEKKPILSGSDSEGSPEVVGRAGPKKKMTFKRAASHVIMQIRWKSFYLKAKEMKHQHEEELTWDLRNPIEKMMFVLEFPFKMARNITLPPCEENEFSRFWALVFPIPFCLFMVLSSTLQVFGMEFYIAIPVGCALMALVFFTCKDGERPKWFILLSLMGILGGLMWTYVLSSIMIDLLQFFGVFLGLQSTYLGLTILAIGNALPDALTTVSLAGQGFAIMGISGGYAGQLFGLLVGFGIAMLKQTIIAGPQEFTLFVWEDISENFLDIVVLFVALFALLVTFIYGIVNHYKFGRGLAYTLGITYVLFFAGATIVEIVSIIQLNKTL